MLLLEWRIESIDVWNFPEIGGSKARQNVLRFRKPAQLVSLFQIKLINPTRYQFPLEERMLVNRRSCKSVLGLKRYVLMGCMHLAGWPRGSSAAMDLKSEDG